MTILAFYPVDNDLDLERYSFEDMLHEDAFRLLWKNRRKLDARFYNIEDFVCDYDEYGLRRYLGSADDFEQDYNDEELDNGGWWCKALLIPSDTVKEIIGITEE